MASILTIQRQRCIIAFHLHAAVNQLPFVSIWHESVNVRDAVTFVEQYGTPEERVDELRVLHANYGSTIAVATGAVPIAQIGGAVAGQFTGRFQATWMERQADKSDVAETEHGNDGKVELVSATVSVEQATSIVAILDTA